MSECDKPIDTAWFFSPAELGVPYGNWGWCGRPYILTELVEHRRNAHFIVSIGPMESLPTANNGAFKYKMVEFSGPLVQAPDFKGDEWY